MSVTATRPTAGSGSPPDPRRRLAVLALADFVVVLDATIVNIALPSIGRDLHGFQSALVVAGVIAALAGLITAVVLPGRARRRSGVAVPAPVAA